jgi:hypothetical protein
MIRHFLVRRDDPDHDQGPVLGEGVTFPSGTAVCELHGGGPGVEAAGLLVEPGEDGLEDLLDEVDTDARIDWLDDDHTTDP